MKTYIYEDNFVSLITLINHLINLKIKPDDIKTINHEVNLFSEDININLKPDYKLVSTLAKNNNAIFKILTNVYLSSDPKKELIIYYFYLNYLKYGNSILLRRNLKCVAKSLEISSYVSREAHKLKGFVRFKELANHVLYAKINPTNNVITILSNHFKTRLKNEFWILHDTQRGIISIYDKKNYYLIPEENIKIDNSYNDDFYTDLWCTFYDTIGIKERKNDRCRLNFMPKKYWQNIIEMRNEIEKSNK